MLPLTVSYFTKHADDRAESVKMAGLYGLSIVATFTLIGIVMAIVVGAAGAQTIASNPWVNLLIAVVLVGFALSLLGLYELRLPSGLVNRVNALGSGSGVMGVWFMGLTLTLVSFSCTAPFVAGLLAAAAGGTWA
jgi:thiol:disulfide interchange protein DsbD